MQSRSKMVFLDLVSFGLIAGGLVLSYPGKPNGVFIFNLLCMLAAGVCNSLAAWYLGCANGLSRRGEFERKEKR